MKNLLLRARVRPAIVEIPRLHLVDCVKKLRQSNNSNQIINLWLPNYSTRARWIFRKKKTLSMACISEDNAQGWQIVQKNEQLTEKQRPLKIKLIWPLKIKVYRQKWS